MRNATKPVVVCIAALITITGCPADSINGKYFPSCTAFEGDIITLSSGRYTWDRFTDQVKVDAQGGSIDQFPDHPQTGTYEIDGKQLKFESGAGGVPPYEHILPSDNRIYLLTADEFVQWQSAGDVAACALVRQ